MNSIKLLPQQLQDRLEELDKQTLYQKSWSVLGRITAEHDLILSLVEGKTEPLNFGSATTTKCGSCFTNFEQNQLVFIKVRQPVCLHCLDMQTRMRGDQLIHIDDVMQKYPNIKLLIADAAVDEDQRHE